LPDVTGELPIPNYQRPTTPNSQLPEGGTDQEFQLERLGSGFTGALTLGFHLVNVSRD